MFGPVTQGDAPSPSAISPVRIAIIGDESFALRMKRRLDHRVAALGFDDEGQGFIDDRPRPIARRGEFGQSGGDVDFRQRLAKAPDRLDFGKRGLTEPLEGGEFQSERAIGGRGDFGLKFGKLIGRKAHRPGHRLAMDEGR